MNRRFFLLAMPALLTGCVTRQSNPVTPGINPYYRNLYAPVSNETYPVAAVNLQQIDPIYLRREVAYPTIYPVGTIVVDTTNHFCYLVQENGQAIRYGIGVAKSQYSNLSGESTIGRKAEWPHWTPTANMMRKQPERYGSMGKGLLPGPSNPLGARALYLYRKGRDTMFRLHGTIEPWTIGKNVSSGCIRFLNQDIIDLYQRVSIGTRVVILS